MPSQSGTWQTRLLILVEVRTNVQYVGGHLPLWVVSRGQFLLTL